MATKLLQTVDLRGVTLYFFRFCVVYQCAEAEYAYQRRKRVIPMMMEPSYCPDGWLGIILGSKLWMDFRKDPSVGIQQLIKEISKARVGMHSTDMYHFILCFSVFFLLVLVRYLFKVVCTRSLYWIFHSAASQAQSVGNAPPKAATKENVMQWKKEDVAKWLQDIGFAV